MQTFNAITSRIFDVVLAPFGHRAMWFDLLFWPIVAGVAALLIYKAVSNQKGIADAKRRIMVNLLEVVLFKDDLGVVVGSTARALWKNAVYVGYNIMPMLVMFVPMTTLLVQLVSHYAYAPLTLSDRPMLVAELDPDVGGVKPREVTLELPSGVVVDEGPVRTADGVVAWRLKPTEEGDFTLTVHAGSTSETKTMSVGGPPRKVSVLRTKSWEALLYPAEAVPEASSPIRSLRLDHHERSLSPLPSGEGGILGWFFGFSLLAGFLLKDRFGVTL